MSFVITIESKEAFEFIQRIVNNSHIKFHKDISGYVEYLDIVDSLKVSFDNPQVTVAETATVVLSTPKTPKKREPKAAIAKLPTFCDIHKTYKAMRAPRTDCKACWSAYKRLNPNHYPLAHRKFIRAQRERTANE